MAASILQPAAPHATPVQGCQLFPGTPGHARLTVRGGIVRAKRCASLIVFSASAVLLSAALLAQSESSSQAPTFRADSNLVLIPVSVTDPLNRFVLGLRKQDFKILDDGVEQSIAHVSGEDVPLSVGLAFDTSGSMDYKLATSKDAAKL